MTSAPDSASDRALLQLLRHLRAQRYRFITTTPLTHSRVVARTDKQRAQSLSDIFGWSLPFAADIVDAQTLALMRDADILSGNDDALRSTLRVSSLGEDLYLHSAYPTEAADAVFFGPDTYRFCRFIDAQLAAQPLAKAPRIADIGCGTGAGGIVAARCAEHAQLLLTDINPAALRLARINAAAANIDAEAIQSDVLAQVEGALDLVVSNPPYLNDDNRRAYRHGGGALGFELSLRIAQQALQRLRIGGRLLLYTGVAIVDGEDLFLRALHDLCAQAACDWRYCELDPDVFGEELERPVYGRVDRIAAVGLVAVKRA